MRLRPGRYTLDVAEGAGPAGVRRTERDPDVAVGIDGGRAEFQVSAPERVFYWWRGPEKRPGVRLLGVDGPDRVDGESDTWPTRTAG